jgi:hypothetical protein
VSRVGWWQEHIPQLRRSLSQPVLPSRATAGTAFPAQMVGPQANPRCQIGLTDRTLTAEATMYLARFSYDVAPRNRQRALDTIRREVEAARNSGLDARILIPLTRAHGGAALQFEIQLTSLDQLEEFRHRGVGSSEETNNWMHAFSEILLSPPVVEILRMDEARSA